MTYQAIAGIIAFMMAPSMLVGIIAWDKYRRILKREAMSNED